MEVQEQQLIAVGTRLPVDLHARFSAICEADRRSMSARMLILVEQYVEYVEQQLNQGS